MSVRSEFGQLSGVIIHEPDIGIGYITPEIAEQLLYDDIVFLPRMIEEHFAFTQALRYLIGEEHVYEIEALLETVLEDKDVKRALLSFVRQIEKLPEEKITFLSGLNARELTFVLVAGLHPETKEPVLKPLPNLVFTRDLGCVINDHIVICKMSKPARWRESVLFKFIVHHHPLFASFKGKIIDFVTLEHFEKEVSIEGGDVMLVHKDYLLTGLSERTNAAGFDLLKETLLEKGIVHHVISVDLPAERYCMHLDTVFTCISENACIGYAPLVFDGNIQICSYDADGRQNRCSSLRELMEEIYPGIRCIPCGNGISPFDAREQWTDGANLVAVKPGVAFSYERNVHTLHALKNAGFTTIDARHLLQETEYGKEYLERTYEEIITITSAELSRARGGPHCMTLPVHRL